MTNLPARFDHISLWNEATDNQRLETLVTVAGLIAAREYVNPNTFSYRISTYASKAGITRARAIKVIQLRLENRIVNFFLNYQ